MIWVDKKWVPNSPPPSKPETPGMLRARIAVRLELARQAHPESNEYMRLMQQTAQLERQLYDMEQSISLKGQPF